MQKEITLELKNITKTFGKTVANKNVNLTVRKGEILSLLGENGSGKTTLMNMISGIYYPDEGQIFINGEEVKIGSPENAYTYGIGMIHQHFKLVDIFTAAENIVLGVKDGTKFNIKDVNSRVEQIASKYGFNIDVKKQIYEMSVSEKQTVEIIKVLYRGADILILDEPTAVLTPQEIKKLFDVLRRMKEDGKSIIIITHKLNEVMEISDRVSILRKGEYIGTVNTCETSENELTEMMVGKKVELKITRTQTNFDKPLLEVRNLSVKGDDGSKKVNDVNFYIRGGEILGVAGVAGCGQKELCEAIAGLRKVDDGLIMHKGESIIGKPANEIIEMGISMSFIPEDRLGMGLAPNFSITDNMMLKTFRESKKFTVDGEKLKGQPKWKAFLLKSWCAVKNVAHMPFVDRKAARKRATELIKRLEIVTPSTETPIRRLSGGNVQKVLVGREIESNPNVIVTAYPVRGLDINSSYVIYDMLNEEKKKGTGILFIGEDLDVMMALCDKIMVLCHGKNMGIVHASKTTKEELGLMMTGALDLSDAKQKEYGKAKDSNLTDEQWLEKEQQEQQAKEERNDG
ncbi:MAG: ABC transporter ATP-binding protein [Clostridia bacterium]|nr:ABC transporter ATP-binding protein [Clostridia bacterium]